MDKKTEKGKKQAAVKPSEDAAKKTAEKKDSVKQPAKPAATADAKKSAHKAGEDDKAAQHPKAAKEKKAAKPKEKTATMKKAEKLRDKIKKKRHPVFRGRFGKKQFRRKSNEKWQKWRYPRGIDIFFRREDGAIPRIGYRVPKEFRHYHPSGMREAMVSNEQQLAGVGQDIVVRIASTVGRKKRKGIIKKANEMGIRILN